MHDPAPVKIRPPFLGVRALMVVAGFLLLLRLLFVFFAFPLGDEAYYWIWGQHPDISYFDHPPLNAWLLGLSSQLFGWSSFAIRFPALLTTAGSIAIFWLWSRRAEGDQDHWFWLAVVAYFATPIIAIFSGMVFSDHLLIFLCLWSLYAFSRFFETWDANAPDWRHLFVAAIILGLAALTKYNAVFVGLAVVLHIVLAPRRYGLLARWELYAAALVCVATLSPLIYWNAVHGFASFKFHTTDRYADVFANASLERFGYFVLFAVIYLGPIVVIALLRMLFARVRASSAAGNGRDLGRLTFLTSSSFFGFLGASGALPYWNIVAYAALFPHLIRWIGARVQLIIHIAFGVLATTIFVVNYAIVPVAVLVGGNDRESAFSYGWDEIVAHVAAAEAEHEPGFLASASYSLAAQLSIARGRDDVTSLSDRVDQYDLWFDPESHAGQSALILVSRVYGLDSGAKAAFASLTEVDRFTITRFGHELLSYVLYLGEGYGGGEAGLPVRP